MVAQRPIVDLIIDEILKHFDKEQQIIDMMRQANFIVIEERE